MITIANLEPSVMSNHLFFSFFTNFYTNILKDVLSKHEEQDRGNDCLISVDGTDFRDLESGSFFYSFKFKRSSL